MTRIRPYKKDDNAHVEQKNWTHIRQWFGYERHDNPEVVEMINALTQGPYGRSLNFYHACLKLERKEKRDGRTVRTYGFVGTPILGMRLVMGRGRDSLGLKGEVRKNKASPEICYLQIRMKENLKRIAWNGFRCQTAGHTPFLGRGIGLGMGLGGIFLPALGQGYFPTINPFVSGPDSSSVGSYRTGFGTPIRVEQVGGSGQQQEYDIKMGPVLANFTAGVTFSYQSNFNQVRSQSGVSAQSLFTLGPTVGVSLQYQISDTATLTVGSGVTYQASLSQFQYEQLSISPNSSVGYQFSVGDVQFNLSEAVSTANQATVDPTISGTGLSSLMEFNRLSNVAGLTVSWPVLKGTTASAGYSYNINTSLGKDNFQQFDSGSHQFNLAVMQELGPTVSVGVLGTGNILEYASTSFSAQRAGSLIASTGQIQNGGSGWAVGSTAQWTVTKAINVTASLIYSQQVFDGTGLIADTSSFSGLTPNFALTHQLSKSITHSISGGRSINSGNGSNFTESYTANYLLSWKIFKQTALGFGFGFNRFAQSAAGFAYVPYDPASPPPNYLYINQNGVAVVPLSSAQVGQQYTATISGTYNITKNLVAGLGYSFIENDLDSNFTILSGVGNARFAGYQTHNVLLSLAYQF